MAAGLPLVGTRVGQMEALVLDEVTGFLVKPGDVAAMAGRLEQLAADPPLRLRMGQAARARAQSELSAAAAVDRMEAALARVALPPRSPRGTTGAAPPTGPRAEEGPTAADGGAWSKTAGAATPGGTAAGKSEGKRG
jgi:hypothetical protein